MTAAKANLEDLKEVVREGLEVDFSNRYDRRVDAESFSSFIRTEVGQEVGASFRSIYISDVTFVGDLDLSDIRTDLSFYFGSCTVTGDVSFHHSKFRTFLFADGQVGQIDADSLECDNDLIFLRCTIASNVNLSDASIGGVLSVRFCAVRSTMAEHAYRTPTLNLPRVRVGRDILVEGTDVSLTGASASGVVSALDMRGADVGGKVSYSGSEIYSALGPAVDMLGVKVEKGFEAESAFFCGTIGVFAMELSDSSFGNVYFNGSSVTSASGAALSFDRSSCRGNFDLLGSRLSSEASFGSLTALDSDVGGLFLVASSTLICNNGPALEVSGSEIGRMRVLDSELATLENEKATLTAMSSRLRGPFEIVNSTLRGNGPLVNLQGLTSRSDILIGSRLTLDGSDEGDFPSVDVGSVRCDGSLTVSIERLSALGKGAATQTLALDDTKIGENLYLNVVSMRKHRNFQVTLNGLSFKDGPRWSTFDEWLSLIREDTTEYSAQPYRHAAHVMREAGHDVSWRKALIAQQQDRRKRKTLESRFSILLNYLSDWFISYGYRPWKGLLGLTMTIVTAFILVLSLADSQAVRKVRTGEVGQCGTADLMSVAAQYSIPLINLNARRTCDIDSSVEATTSRSAGLLGTQVAGWAFTTLFVVGFTNLIRKQ